MLNAKQIENNKKWLTFWSNFFNLLTRWLGGKLKSLPCLLRVYRVYLESTKKRVYSKSQFAEDKWARKLVRVSELTWEFDNHGVKYQPSSTWQPTCQITLDFCWGNFKK